MYLVLSQKVQELEASEGVKTNVDRKTVARLVDHLAAEGKITKYETSVTVGDQEKKVGHQRPWKRRAGTRGERE